MSSPQPERERERVDNRRGRAGFIKVVLAAGALTILIIGSIAWVASRKDFLTSVFSDSKYQTPVSQDNDFSFGLQNLDLPAKTDQEGPGKIDGSQSTIILQKDFSKGIKIVTVFGDLELVPVQQTKEKSFLQGEPSEAKVYKNAVVYEFQNGLAAYLYNKENHELKELVVLRRIERAEENAAVLEWRITNSADYRLAYEQGAIAFYGVSPSNKNSSSIPPEFKNLQYFKIPAPVIVENNESRIKNPNSPFTIQNSSAFWEVSGDILSLKIKDLEIQNSPLIIDPAIVIGASKVTDPQKKIKDEHTKKLIQDQGMDPDYVELAQNYGKRLTPQEKALKNNNNSQKNNPDPSPYARTYRDNMTGKYVMEVQGLPMVDADGVAIDPQWEQMGQNYKEKGNLFNITVKKNGNTTIKVKNDQPDGRKQNDQLTFQPQLFLNGVEQTASAPVLLPVDPVNPNYQNNVLEWDYGIAKRRLRLIEGKILGSWVFDANPNGEVRMKYNQVGDYKLKLGQFANGTDEELVPASVFTSATYPFTVSDSATYNPDASPETTSVDGAVWHWAMDNTWSFLVSASGTDADDSTNGNGRGVEVTAYSSANKWTQIRRLIFLFDSSGLPDSALISAATLSLYGLTKYDNLAVTPNINIYSSAPASNTTLAAGDFDSLGATAFATAITYAGWSISGYNDFALNSTGYGTISKTGVSKFGARNANYDAANSAPAWSSNNNYGIMAYHAEEGAGYKPKLVVTYTVPPDWQPRPGGVQPSGGSFLIF